MMNRNILHPMMFETPTPPGPIVDTGIYWSQSLGLISLSDDGENWITMSDKNLGATQVYNVGDVQTTTNSGYYYQRGNNYGFPYNLEGWDKYTSEQINAANYGPYYDDEFFRLCSTYIPPPPPYFYSQRRDSSRNMNIRGHETGTYEAMRGPCSEGYHIPSVEDYNTLLDILSRLGKDISTGECLMRYLKMPNAGRLNRETGEHMNGSQYWATGCRRWEYGWKFGGSGIFFNESTLRTDRYHMANWQTCAGSLIRPFKNEFMVPDYDNPHSVWITIQPGIFWEPVQGFISVTQDGVTGITIADKNLGAIYVYEYGDELTQGNCGGFFQYGNNHLFPYGGELSTLTPQVNAWNYGPYYSNDYWNQQSIAWDSSKNGNLWGGVTGTNKAKQGPCSVGFHVPSAAERQNIIDMFSQRGIGRNHPENYLKMPRHSGGNVCYWSTDASYEDEGNTIKVLGTLAGGVSWAIEYYAAVRTSVIRPFKNEPVVPDSTWTKLY